MAIGRIGARDADTYIETYRFVPSGGETSLSGTDAGGRSLTYPLNNEFVFLNGVRLVRGQDYTATTGTSITGLSALDSGDIVEIIVFQSVDTVAVDFADVVFAADAPTSPNNGTIWIESDATVNVADYIAPTVVDAKGDLIVGSANDTVTRVQVGADNTVLTADSSTASGVKWAAASGGEKISSFLLMGA